MSQPPPLGNGLARPGSADCILSARSRLLQSSGMKTWIVCLIAVLGASPLFAQADLPVPYSPKSHSGRGESLPPPAAPAAARPASGAEAKALAASGRYRAEKDTAPAAGGAAPVRYSYAVGAGEGWSYAARGERPLWEGFGDFAAFYEGDSFYERFLRGKLAAGLVLSFPVLDDKRREDAYLGNLVDEKEEGVGFFPEAEYTVCPFFRLMLSYYKIAFSAYNRNNGHASDGTASLEGPWVSAKAQWPVWDGRILPYASFGLAFLQGGFDAEAWWHYGYSSPAAFREQGSRKVLRGDHYREMEVDDATAFVWGVGVACRPFEHWELDLFANFMDAEADADFFLHYPADGSRRLMRHGSFAFDNHQFGIAAKYIF